jgi:hypothetical protein
LVCFNACKFLKTPRIGSALELYFKSLLETADHGIPVGLSNGTKKAFNAPGGLTKPYANEISVWRKQNNADVEKLKPLWLRIEYKIA